MAIGGLGAGLDSLFSDNSNDIQVKKTLRTSEIEPNRDQPRKVFNDEAITALADSIREHGMLQPILVRPIGTGYQIVAGERRYRASILAGRETIPAIIRNFSDDEMMEIARQIRTKRMIDISSAYHGITKKAALIKGDFLQFFEERCIENNSKYYGVFKHFYEFSNGYCTFDQLSVTM